MTVDSNDTNLHTYSWVEPMSYQFFFFWLCVCFTVLMELWKMGGTVGVNVNF